VVAAVAGVDAAGGLLKSLVVAVLRMDVLLLVLLLLLPLLQEDAARIVSPVLEEGVEAEGTTKEKASVLDTDPPRKTHQKIAP